jgi:hypothetical protein
MRCKSRPRTPTSTYAGVFFNADSGLYLTPYRAYDPVAGRRLSRDPVSDRSAEPNPLIVNERSPSAERLWAGITATTSPIIGTNFSIHAILPDGLNVYGYVAQNPVVWTDR